MRRIRIVLAYDGTDYHGWQTQPGIATIQGEIEAVVSEIEGSAVDVHGSGRTDAGVHALAQVAAFSIANPIPCPNLKRAMNRLLPPAIRVLETAEASSGFHPRFDARSKTYEYRIFRGEVCSPFERRFVLHHPYPLDSAAMARAAVLFSGEHDFSAFAASDERDALGHSKVRSVTSSVILSEGDRLIYRIAGSGFLKHMVRHIVGTLMEVGKGNLDEHTVRHLLTAPPGEKAIHAVPARGLFLVRVEY